LRKSCIGSSIIKTCFPLATYLLFIQVLLFLLSVVLLRHLYWRTRFFVHMFQQSGYKLNEFWLWMKDHWNSHVLNGTHALTNVLLLLFVVFIGHWFTPTAPAVIISVYLMIWFWPVDLYRRQEKKPLAYTARVQRLLIPVTLLVILFPVLGALAAQLLKGMLPDVYMLAFGWVFGVIMVPFWVLLAGFLTKPIEKYIQKGFIRSAQQKLASMPGLTVIGITGSYGKTSTKFALASMLSERFSVCFTPGSFNTPMGICKVINNDLQAHHQVLILEMGARYPGNIAELCEIAHPNIAILTIIGKAHLETFGSQEVIAKTKGELIQSLHPGELAVVNADDHRVMAQAARRNDISVIGAGLQQGDFTATDIRYDASGCSFTVCHKDGRQVPVRTGLLGQHNVYNILFGFAVGDHLGLRLETLALAVSRMEPVEHRLQLKQTATYTVIDDAFNSNPVGARNAIDVLAGFQGGKRVLVTPGMVELGDIEEEENFMLGEHIGTSGIEQVILVGQKQTKPIQDGLRSAGYPEEKTLIVKSLFEANAWLQQHLTRGDVVLYENDLPDMYVED